MAKNVAFGIKIDAEVSGQESVEQLTTRLDDMAKVLEGELKTEAQAVSARLKELADQQGAINGVQQLQRAVKDAGVALAQAEREAADFATQIVRSGPPTAQEAASLQRLQTAAEGARQGLEANRSALAGAAAELQRHGVAANQTQAAQARLNTEMAELRARAETLNPAFRGNAAAATAAGEAMQRSHRAVGEGVQSISAQLQRVQSAYLALAGGGVLGGMLKDVVQTADAWQQLGARIKLVTGDGADFARALEGVQRVALATRSDLEATGTLFTKLAAAGKELGLSQSQALGLTQTINQAIQITGGSADAAKAAITQLTQGLQSGTLRGDEFNSVMEQAPRLAQALAAGLGVGTGELRKMAEQGQLTSEAVIKALQGQTQAIEGEFARLPVTVGGALQNLSTAWTAFVGDLNQGTGATQKLAQGIAFLADHMGELGSVAATLGQGALAVGLLRITQGFLAWAGNARLAAVATTELAAATTALAGAAARAEAAQVGSATKAGLLATAWGGVANAGSKLLGLIGGPVGLVALTAAYAKDIGELAAKLVLKAQGLKNLEQIEAQRLKQELEAAEATEREIEARRRQVEADKAAADAKFGLTKVAASLVDKFAELVKGGKATDDALAEIGKGFDLTKHAGIRDAAGVLDKLRATGQVTAQQFQEAWAKALNGQDLLEFEKKARVALAGSKAGAEQLQQALDAGLREAIRRAGLDFELISGGMGKAAKAAVSDLDFVIRGLDRLKAQGVDAGAVLQSSLSEAIKKADTERAIEEVRQRIEGLRKELGIKVADGLLAQANQQLADVKLKADLATPGINSLAEAMKVLGVTSQESLQRSATQFREAYDYLRTSGKATVNELREGFIQYAEAAIKANSGVASSSLKAEAAVRGVRIEGDRVVETMGKAERAGHRAGDGIATGMDRAKKAAQETGNAMADVLRKLGAVTDAAGNVIRNADGSAPGGSSGIRARGASGIEFGNDKRTDDERARLQQQGGPVDASYNFEVRRRLEAGEEFSPQEAAALANGLRVALLNQSLGQPGSVTLEGRRGDAAWVEVFRRALEKATYGALGGAEEPRRPIDSSSSNSVQAAVAQQAAVAAHASTTVIINLASGQSQTVNVATPSDANALRELLQRLVDDKSRSGGP